MPYANINDKIRGTITTLESCGKTQSDDIFLGVSALNQEANDLLQELGWNAIYANAGFYQFFKK